MTVGEPGHADRHGTRAGVALGDERLDRGPERSLERGAGPAASLEPLELVVEVGAEHGPHELLDGRRMLPGKEPAVDRDVADGGNHVPLRGGRDHRR